MKAFIAAALLAVVVADQSHHQVVKHGNAPAVSVAVHKPHGAYHASVASQPHVAPQSVHGYGHHEKAVTAVHAPAAVPHHAPAPYHPAPYHPAPYHPKPAPYHPAPAAAYKPSPYDKEEPAPYAFEYGVADDYSKAAFNAAETADANGAVTGSYSVALPDGRTQHVKYTADHYNGYVADVSYEGVPVYPEAKPYVPAK